MVAVTDVPAINRLTMELDACERARDALQEGNIVNMMAAQSDGEQTWGNVAFDTTLFPGMDAVKQLMVDVINWRIYLIKEALQGLGVDTDPPTSAETASFNSHQMTQRQRRK
jgi:hypothetical protein